jgi:hypothetical protein
MNEITQDAELQAALNERRPVAPVAVAKPDNTEARKLAAFLPDTRSIGGKSLAPYTQGRKILLKRTGNELLRLRDHAVSYAAGKGVKPEELMTEDWATIIATIPDIDFHAVAFLYVLAADVATLHKLTRNADDFQEAVLRFADTLRGSERGILPLVFDILNEAATGRDYEVVDEQGGPSPN